MLSAEHQVGPTDLLAAELAPQEKLLWAGRARQGFWLRASDLFLIPFSLLWASLPVAFEIIMLRKVARGSLPWFYALFVVPFLIAALYVVLGRFLLDAIRREYTLYAVTAERVIIIAGVFRPVVESVPVDTLPDLSLSERGDGSGVIILGHAPWWNPIYTGADWGLYAPDPPRLILARNARDVYAIIASARRNRNRE